MKRLQGLTALCAIALLSACSSTYSNDTKTNARTPYHVKGNVKRINTTECKDIDDWYLDGYRVGKSFNAQKTQMLEQRLSFCNLTLKQLPNDLKTSWDKGFTVGNREYGKPMKNKVKSKKKNRRTRRV